MKFNVLVKKGQKDNQVERIDIESLQSLQDTSKDDLWEYRDLFSKIIADSKYAESYIYSSTLARMEGITLFYESLCKYIYCVKIAERSKESIAFSGLDYKTAKAIITCMREKGYKVEYEYLKVRAYELKERIKFVFNVPRAVLLSIIFVFASKIHSCHINNRRYDYGFMTFYDYRSVSCGKHYEQYFDPLLKSFIAENKSIIVFNQVLHNNKPSLFFKYLNQIRLLNTSYHNVIWYAFVGLSDIISSIIKGIMNRPRVDDNIIFKGYNISYITRLALCDDLFKLAWFHSYLIGRFSYNVLKKFNIGSVLYPYENHPWEKAFVLSRNELGSGTKLIAFQHTSFSFKLLQHFPGRYEKNLPIFPDKILTVGRILKDVMNEYGHYPDGIIEEGCALRHSYLFSPAARCSDGRPKKKVAYAFSFDDKNYPRILKCLADIFEKSDYKVLLKFHPINIGYMAKAGRLPSNLVDAKDISWDDVFNDIDMLLYDDNSLCIECLKNNVRVCYFAMAEQVYDTDRLFKYEKDKIIARSVREFKALLDKYLSSRESNDIVLKEVVEYNEHYLREYFSPVNEECIKRFS